ncbi:hypothetical protein D9M69_623760 [compost metagenome]
MLEQTLFLRQGRVRPANIEAALGELELGDDRLHAVRVEVDDGGAFHGVGDRLECDPAAGVTRHGPTVQAVIEVFLYPGRCQHRHHDRLENVLGLMRQGRGAGTMVVAGNRQHAAELRSAGGIGVTEYVAATVHARALAVPHAEYAIVLGTFEQVDLLGAP